MEHRWSYVVWIEWSGHCLHFHIGEVHDKNLWMRVRRKSSEFQQPTPNGAELNPFQFQMGSCQFEQFWGNVSNSFQKISREQVPWKYCALPLAPPTAKFKSPPLPNKAEDSKHWPKCGNRGHFAQTYGTIGCLPKMLADSNTTLQKELHTDLWPDVDCIAV